MKATPMPVPMPIDETPPTREGKFWDERHDDDD